MELDHWVFVDVQKDVKKSIGFLQLQNFPQLTNPFNPIQKIYEHMGFPIIIPFKNPMYIRFFKLFPPRNDTSLTRHVDTSGGWSPTGPGAGKVVGISATPRAGCFTMENPTQMDDGWEYP